MAASTMRENQVSARIVPAIQSMVCQCILLGRCLSGNGRCRRLFSNRYWRREAHAIKQYGRRKRDRDDRSDKGEPQRILVRDMAAENWRRHVAEQVEDKDVGGEGGGAHVRSDRIDHGGIERTGI